MDSTLNLTDNPILNHLLEQLLSNPLFVFAAGIGIGIGMRLFASHRLNILLGGKNGEEKEYTRLMREFIQRQERREEQDKFLQAIGELLRENRLSANHHELTDGGD